MDKYIILSVIVIISTAFLVMLGVWLNTLNIKREVKNKILGIAIFVVIILVGSEVFILIKDRNEELKSAKKIEETYQLAQRGEASRLGLPQSYIDSLQKDPLLKHSFNVGQRYEKEYEFEEAISEYKKCLEHPNATAIDKTSAHFLIGNCYYFLGKLKEAEDEYNKSLRTSKNIKDNTDRLMGNSAIQIDIGNIYMRLSQPKKALGYCEKALKNYREIGFKQGEAIILNNIGNIYTQLGQLQEALNYHQQTLRIHREMGFQHGEATTLGNIGVIYSLLDQPQEALSYYMDALEIYRKIDYKIYYPQDIATNLFNIGSAYLNLGQPKEALGYFQDALEIYEEIGYQEGKAVALSNIGDVYQCLEQPQEALFYYEKALKIYKILDNQSQIKKLLSFINNIEEKISIK